MIGSIVRVGVVSGLLVAMGASPALAQYGSWSYGGGSGESSACGDSSRWGDGDWGGGGRLRVLGLTADQRLICFGEDDPGNADDIGFIAGLSVDVRLVGIDFRPFNRKLYGVGNAGGLYTLDPRTAFATKVGQLTVPLEGASFGVDVNPAADALRIISETGQNLRYVFATGVTNADGRLTYPPNPATAMGVTGAAYTNNDSDANTATTLYDVDTTLDQVAIQSPANAGTLAATGKLTVDTTSQTGFDIYSTIRNGTTVDIQAFASLTVGGFARFYKITLFTGKATLRGSFRSDDQVIGIAIPLNQL